MARIPTLASVGVKTHRVIAGPGAVRVAPEVAGYASLGTVVAVGLTSGGINITPSVDPLELESDQLFGNYSMVETKIGFTVEFSMDQTDIWNINLQTGYGQGAVVTTTVETFTFDQDVPSKYHGLELITEGGRDTNASAAITHTWSFYKVKILPNGAIPVGRGVKAVLPTMAHCLMNDSGVFGKLTTSGTITKPVYE